ncbi:MAG: barstar family protein [Ruminococcus sp.]|nr:barstar family protein [Ruminococcus sp.]
MKVIIDGNIISHRLQLHDFLASELNFPETYGKNLDALYDCLTDIHDETEIEIINYNVLYDNLGNYAKVLSKMLMQASKENKFIKFSSDM